MGLGLISACVYTIVLGSSGCGADTTGPAPSGELNILSIGCKVAFPTWVLRELTGHESLNRAHTGRCRAVLPIDHTIFGEKTCHTRGILPL